MHRQAQAQRLQRRRFPPGTARLQGDLPWIAAPQIHRLQEIPTGINL